MAYSVALEMRLDNLIVENNIKKKKMFGGIAYLMDGNMCFGVHKEDLVIRTSKEIADKMLTKNYIRPMDITGRPMKGWLFVSPEYLTTDERVNEMIDVAKSFVESLPPK